MLTSIITPVFKAPVKPHHPGVYQLQRIPDFETDRYAYFDGKLWYPATGSINMAVDVYVRQRPSAQQHQNWHGLTSDIAWSHPGIEAVISHAEALRPYTDVERLMKWCMGQVHSNPVFIEL